MNNILLIALLLFSCLFSQYNISTKQYSFFKSDDLNEIDFSNIISNINGKYSLELISVENPDFKKIKKTLLETCDLKFSLLNKSSNIHLTLTFFPEEEASLILSIIFKTSTPS